MLIEELKDWIKVRAHTKRIRRVTLANARGRAARGATYLDDAAPGWTDAINPSSLDLSHANACILGQLHGSFSLGLGRSGLFSLGSAPRASFSPVDLGFHCVQGLCETLQKQDYTYLNQAWSEEIEKRTDHLVIVAEGGAYLNGHSRTISRPKHPADEAVHA